jgi:hypothetical protein
MIMNGLRVSNDKITHLKLLYPHSTENYPESLFCEIHQHPIALLARVLVSPVVADAVVDIGANPKLAVNVTRLVRIFQH